MSVEATTWVWEHSKASGNDLIILLKIADNANADGGGAYPGITYLGKAAKISRRAVFDCLRRLKASGELIEEQRGGGRMASDGTPGRKTIFRVVMGEPGNGATSAPLAADETVQPGDGTVQPDVPNGADSRSALIRNRTTLEPSKESPPPAAAEARNEKVEQPRPEVDALCRHLAGQIIANGGSEARYRPKPTTKAWRDPMRRLIDLDKVSPDRIRKAIDWCQADDFWKGVILSPANLRENYDKLRLRASQQQNGNGHRVSNGEHRYVNDDRWKPATTPRRAYGQDYTPEQKAELDRLLEEEWAGRQVLGHNLPGRTP